MHRSNLEGVARQQRISAARGRFLISGSPAHVLLDSLPRHRRSGGSQSSTGFDRRISVLTVPHSDSTAKPVLKQEPEGPVWETVGALGFADEQTKTNWNIERHRI
jgi:hypothetical protein